MLIPEDLRDLAVAFAMATQVANDVDDRLKLALKRLSACGRETLVHVFIKGEIVYGMVESGNGLSRNTVIVSGKHSRKFSHPSKMLPAGRFP